MGVTSESYDCTWQQGMYPWWVQRSENGIGMMYRPSQQHPKMVDPIGNLSKNLDHDMLVV